MSAYKRIVTILIALVLLAGLVGPASAEKGPTWRKVMPHVMPAGDLGLAGGKLNAIPFNNPDYTYAKVIDAGSAIQRNAGLRPQGDKIVTFKEYTPGPKYEIFLYNIDGTGETMISPGDSGTGDIAQYSNPVWSDDGTKVAWIEVHNANANPNKIQVYDITTATRSYLYEPGTGLDVANFDFLGPSTTKIVFWDIVSGEADLFIYDAVTHTRTNITNSAGYKEYEPVSNLAGDKIVYWSGETAALEPVNTTHILQYNPATKAWDKDPTGFTPIPDSYWAFYSGRPDERIGLTVMSTKDVRVYNPDGISYFDLTGPGYSPAGGSARNFFGSHFESLARDIWFISNADNTAGGRDVYRATEALPKLYLDPEAASIPNDNSTTKTFTVRLANAVDLYGYQFVVTFDATNLEATGAVSDTSFFNGPVVPGDWNCVIDNVAGTVKFAMSRQNPQAAVSGSGPLATVTFKSKSSALAGAYPIDFQALTHVLANIEGVPLSHTTQGALLTLYNTGTLKGTVEVQGRPGRWQGAEVSIWSLATGYSASMSVINTDGTWEFTGVPAGSYQVNVEMARYLDAQKGEYGAGVVVTAGSPTTLSQVKVLGGDTNDDDHIYIGDLSTIGGAFGTTPPSVASADINNDATVNILDLVLAAGNYGKFSITNVPW
jgi:hypothetical protein